MSPRNLIELAVVVVAIGCDPPDDVLFVPPVVEPVEVRPNLFRLTRNTGPDVVRGFTPDGSRIVYRSRGLVGPTDEWHVLSVPLAGGAAREEAAVYRTALLQPVAGLVIQNDRRILSLWRDAPGPEICDGCPTPPTSTGVAILRLGATDGVAISALPTRAYRLVNLDSPTPCDHRVRINPPEMEIRARGVDPYGPAVPEQGSIGVYSDGEALWRFDLDDATVAAESIGPGTFPALAPDGALLAAALPAGTDSVSDICIGGLCPCIQETVTITPQDWEVVVYDLTADTSWTVTRGLEPIFSRDGTRLIVRRLDALYWVDLAGGAEVVIPGTSGAYSARLSPDGSLIAFSTSLDQNADVFYVRVVN